jgi:hypothetical protein
VLSGRNVDVLAKNIMVQTGPQQTAERGIINTNTYTQRHTPTPNLNSEIIPISLSYKHLIE